MATDNIGALTTAFVPPSACLYTGNIWQIHTTYTDGPRADRRFELFGAPLDASPNCYPKDYSPRKYYSPGVCPSGYTIATAQTNAIGSLTETTHICCPSAIPMNLQTQRIPNPNFPFLDTLRCESTYTAKGTFTLTSSEEGREPTPAVYMHPSKPGAINAYAVVVRFQATDFASKTLSSFSSTSSPSLSGTTSSSPAPSSTDISKDSGLSTGASVGIGVGAGAVGLAAIIGTVWFILRSRKKKQRNAYSDGLPACSDKQHPMNVYANEISGESALQELGTTAVAVSAQRPSELEGR
ncbi:hypothetical protein P171DRAFT_518562 [Karstenula rhodostoma CBS 690.94]|uniref:Uncharacterized protein n=1 Tax=Karstenula rhodostoma CBS 690.94 TaxID=1392251 RepID=A0A9P4PLS9_9PLEO|nr:hypothetical protein P171DRAFT_518562 [Karstenula rhodostoma CBS 690.94]